MSADALAAVAARISVLGFDHALVCIVKYIALGR